MCLGMKTMRFIWPDKPSVVIHKIESPQLQDSADKDG